MPISYGVVTLLKANGCCRLWWCFNKIDDNLNDIAWYMGHTNMCQFHTEWSHFLRLFGSGLVYFLVICTLSTQAENTFWKEFMSKSSQKVQNCQFLKFLEWETVVYIWTFKNLIEPLIDHSTAKYLWCYMYFWRQYFKSLFKSPSKKLQHTFLKRGGRGSKAVWTMLKTALLVGGGFPGTRWLHLGLQ